MVYSSEVYIHEMDRKAFAALNKFPHFVKLCEKYNALYSEKQAKISLLSAGVRLSDKQMSEIYRLLPPICEKLDIVIPELYYVRSKDVNAFSIGTTNPCICITSGLVKKLSSKQLSSVLAHECGHIACKHSLYHSIVGTMIYKFDVGLQGELALLGRYLTPGMINAFKYWERCSELSADRAAALCDGSADNTVDTLLEIEGYGKVDRDEFIKQAFDLNSFINDSKSNKTIEWMITKENTHPLLATRVYECCEWAKSDVFKSLILGTYNNVVKEQIKEEDVLTGELEFTVKDKKCEKAVLLEQPQNSKEIDEALERINSELERYTNNNDRVSYSLAVFSGIYSGILDAVLVGRASFDEMGIALSHQQVNNFIQEYAKSKGIGGDRLKDCIAHLEKKFEVIQDNAWSGEKIGVAAKNHHLADMAHHPTPIGLVSAIIVQFLRVGTFVNKNGEWHFLPLPFKDDKDHEKMKDIAAAAILTGILNWIVAIAEKMYDDENDEVVPKALSNIVHLIASTPILIEVAKCADNWFGHLVSDMGGSKNTAGGGMGIPGIFISLLYEVGSLPVLKDSGLLEFVNDLYVNKRIDLRHEMCLYKSLGVQSIPVLYNEIFVRLVYFVGQLAAEIGTKESVKEIDWKNTIPFRNRTVDRMLTIASMTFTMADTADAAVHAAIESCGNWILFSGSFVSRFNYVAAGRAALCVVREISNEKNEAQLIHEKMILTEAKTVSVIEQFDAYRKDLNERLLNYLAEDIEEFLNGFDYMRRGINVGDSDLVIKGNVVIQRVLGREPQFTNQKEFDELMDSDDAFVL